MFSTESKTETKDVCTEITQGNVMSKKQKWRGHYIVFVNGEWLYADNEMPTANDRDRECGYCGRSNTKEGHDGCIGTLPNVMNACCGHGVQSDAYVQFLDETCIYGEDAIELMKKHYKFNGGTMSLDIEIVPIENFEVKINGESIGIFEKKSSWEGMVKLQNKDGIVIANDENDTVGKMLSDIFNIEKQSSFSVVKITPSLIPQKENKS